MNHRDVNQPKAASEAIDRILASEPELVPSSGFLAGVMERVREEAAVPTPLAFPWKRVLPGVAVTAGFLLWAGYETARWLLPALREELSNPPRIELNLAFFSGSTAGLGLAAAAVLVSWLIAARVVRRA